MSGCVWVLGGHSQAHGMKGQATQPQESPSQHPQGAPQTGGRPLPPHPHQTVAPLGPTPSAGPESSPGSQRSAPRVPHEPWKWSRKSLRQVREECTAPKIGENVMSTGPLSHESKIDPKTPHLPHLRYIPPAPIQPAPTHQHLMITRSTQPRHVPAIHIPRVAPPGPPPS